MRERCSATYRYRSCTLERGHHEQEGLHVDQDGRPFLDDDDDSSLRGALAEWADLCEEVERILARGLASARDGLDERLPEPTRVGVARVMLRAMASAMRETAGRTRETRDTAGTRETAASPKEPGR